jgi:hypothetical protein
VLLPVVGLVRRMDLVEVIGAALVARAAGASQRQLAAELGLARSTLRGWLGRFIAHAEPIRAHFTRLAIWLDARTDPPPPRGSPLADAVEAIGLAAIVAARRFGPTSPWQLAAGASGGLLLAPAGRSPGGPGASNTSPPFPAWW